MKIFSIIFDKEVELSIHKYIIVPGNQPNKIKMYLHDDIISLPEFKKQLNENNLIVLYSFPKRFYLPRDIVFDITDDNIEYLKKRNIFYLFQKRIINDIPFSLISIHLIYFLKMYFLSKGYKLTAESKEDDYINILNSDDEILIKKLQLYLTLLDNISVLNFNIDKVYNYYFKNNYLFNEIYTLLQ
jgi:hypothetical protein